MLLIQPVEISDITSLRSALQKAIELEHATIPPYLTAYYTLRGASQGSVAARQLIHGIVVQEMRHMQMVANILNAIGGEPVINSPDFVPNYPDTLPMGIGGALGLKVGIKRYSKATIKDTFLEIEEPEKPIQIPVKAAAADLIAPVYETIGGFYAAVADEIKRQGEAIFTGDQRRQVPGVPVVTDVESALEAIATIVTQGEGTTTSPADAPRNMPITTGSKNSSWA